MCFLPNPAKELDLTIEFEPNELETEPTNYAVDYWDDVDTEAAEVIGPDDEELHPGYLTVSEQGTRYHLTRGVDNCEGTGMRGWRIGPKGEPEPTAVGYCANKARRFGLCGSCAAYAQTHGIEHVERPENEVLAFSDSQGEDRDWGVAPGDVADRGDHMPMNTVASAVDTKHEDIRAGYASGRTQIELAHAFGMSLRQVRRIVKDVERAAPIQRAKRGEGLCYEARTSTRVVEVDQFEAARSGLKLTPDSIATLNESGERVPATVLHKGRRILVMRVIPSYGPDLRWERTETRKAYSTTLLRALPRRTLP